MTCPSCRRDNHAQRRYCGGCGCNFAPACDACGFANEAQDRFCGGCGQGLRAGERDLRRPAAAAVRAAVHAAIPSHARAAQAHPAPPAAPAPAAAARAAASGSPWDASELAELFAPPAVAEDSADLPEVGIAQDDVDRLFGAVP